MDFTTFLLVTGAAVSALMVGLLLRPRRRPEPEDRIPYTGIALFALALALAVWGLSILG